MMMSARFRSETNYLGFALATLLAGPIFVMSLELANWMMGIDTHSRPMEDWTWLVALLPMMFFFVAGGAFLSIIPNLIGLTVMTWLGNRHAVMQWPISWALAGALPMAVKPVRRG
jgi:hypothetical protein